MSTTPTKLNQDESEIQNLVESEKTKIENSSNTDAPFSPLTSTQITGSNIELTKKEEKENSTHEEKKQDNIPAESAEKKPEKESTKKQELSFGAEYNKFLEILKLFSSTFSLIKPYLIFIITTYALTLLQTGLNMMSPMYVGNIVDIVTRSKSASELQNLVINMIIFSITTRLVARAGDLVRNRVSEAFRRNVKGEIYRKVLERDMSFFDKITPTEAANAISTGVDTLQELYFSSIIGTLQQILSLIGNFWLMYVTSPKLLIIVLILTPIKFLLTYLSIKSSNEFYKDYHKIWMELWNLPNQALTNIPLVKSFSTEKKEHKLYLEKQEEFSKYEAKGGNGKFFDFNMIICNMDEVLNAVLVWVGGIMAFQGEITPGHLSTFNLYQSEFSNAFLSITYTFKWLYQSFINSEKIISILQENKDKEKTKGESQGITKSNLKGRIVVNTLSFSYPSKPEREVLKDINLEINAGESVAFVGASGSGKTTMLTLLQNLYSPTKGDIVIDGQNVNDYNLVWLHQNMGYVSQEPVLLERSIEDNITYGLDKYVPEQIDKALTLSNSRFILNKEKFPDGLQTKIGAEGVKLSGGEKQRIAIARAFAKDPKILILDEPTSALDGESESQVQQAIDELTSFGDRTVIVVAHRLSTIINCSKIFVFDDGKVVEEGSHRELIEKNGVYKKLFEFQMNNMKKL